MLRLVVAQVRDATGAVLAQWLLLTNVPAEVLAERVALWTIGGGEMGVFQQITEVFACQVRCSTTPQGTLFPLRFCLLLYNLIQVVRAHVACAQRPVESISTELLSEAYVGS